MRRRRRSFSRRRRGFVGTRFKRRRSFGKRLKIGWRM